LDRYDIDPKDLGALTPLHPLSKKHPLIEMRTELLEELGRSVRLALTLCNPHCRPAADRQNKFVRIANSDKQDHISGPKVLRDVYAVSTEVYQEQKAATSQVLSPCFV